MCCDAGAHLLGSGSEETEVQFGVKPKEDSPGVAMADMEDTLKLSGLEETQRRLRWNPSPSGREILGVSLGHPEITSTPKPRK